MSDYDRDIIERSRQDSEWEQGYLADRDGEDPSPSRAVVYRGVWAKGFAAAVEDKGKRREIAP